MLDYNAQTQTVKQLIDEAAYWYWSEVVTDANFKDMKREHKRASNKMVEFAYQAGRMKGKRQGLDHAIRAITGAGRLAVRDVIDTRAQELYGKFSTHLTKPKGPTMTRTKRDVECEVIDYVSENFSPDEWDIESIVDETWYSGHESVSEMDQDEFTDLLIKYAR